MLKHYTVGLRMLIGLSLCMPSAGNVFSNVKPGGREDSGKISIPKKTTVDAPHVCGDINLTSQAQVDAFPATYDCSDITGTLSISGPDITNVDSLASLRSISSTLTINYNPKLTNLNGLRGITSISGLVIRSNPVLTNLNGLQGITSSNTGLEIVDNGNLANLDGLSGLSYVGWIFLTSNNGLTNIDGLSSVRIVSGVVTLRFNNQLANLRGFMGVTSMPGLEINGNNNLTDLTGLAGLDSINGDVSIIANTSLTAVKGLSSLKKVKSMTISSNPVLANLEGLSSLQTINGSLAITGNPLLANLHGLSGLTDVQGITISNNAALTSLQGLTSLTTIRAPGDLNISQNSSLTDIDFQRFTTLAGSLIIADNTSLTGLKNLSTLQTIGGALTISNTGVANLDSLHSLTRVGKDLEISKNSNLTSLTGLSLLTYVGAGGGPYSGAHIKYNPKLTNLDGLNKLVSIAGMLDISYNATLINLDGLSSLASLGSHFPDYLCLSIMNNAALTTLKGLRSLTTLPGPLFIENNASLPNLDGLESLTKISGYRGSLTVQGNSALTNMDGLSALTLVSGQYAFVNISNNSSLVNLNGLSSLKQINDGGPSGSLVIQNNASLADVDGLSSLTSIGSVEEYLTVVNNPNLTRSCGLYRVINGISCEYCRPHFSISGNGAGCTKDEILAGGPCCTSPGRCPQAEPTAQPTNLTLAKVTDNSMTVSFSAAAGAPTGYITLMQAFCSPFPDDIPVDGTSYQVGGRIGYSVVVGLGMETSLDIIYLNPGIDYYFDVFSYNKANGICDYLTVNPLAGSQRTASSGSPSGPTDPYDNLPWDDAKEARTVPFPNPFSDNVTIPFTTKNQNVFVQIAVYDALGKKMADLVNQSVGPGYHEAKWERSDNLGNKVPQGMYSYSIQTDESDHRMGGKMIAK